MPAARVRPGDGYRQALYRAYALGRADGRLAAAFELTEPPDSTAPVCRGRGPADFARLLWAGRPGPVPAGLEANGPLWYATGLADELTAQR